ncbi:MAG: hypothetical protein JST01_09695 [Cyanobacteria bacterium SZAS TMP-1]|nr:hypothetical protein [Cyanobacteria bacterium SZAS TMP-1]
MKIEASAKTIIDLNGPAEWVEILLLVSMVPLYGVVFPLVGLSCIASFSGPVLVGTSFFCALHFYHLCSNNFTFKRDGLRMPGVDHRLLPFSNVKRIYLDSQYLAMEFVPLKNVFRRNSATGPLVVQLFAIQHMTGTGALQLWESFSSNLRDCDVAPEVRDKLLNWRPTMAELAEVKESRPIKVVRKCLMTLGRLSASVWFTFWITVALFVYPVTIIYRINPVVAKQLITEISALIPKGIIDFLWGWVLWLVQTPRP